MANNKHRNSVTDTTDKQTVDLDVTDSAVMDQPAESTTTANESTKNVDDLAKKIDDFSSSKSEKSFSKGKQKHYNTTKNNNVKLKTKNEKSSNHSVKTQSSVEKTDSSSVTTTSKNTLSNFSQAIRANFTTTGWIEGANDSSIWDRINQIFESTGVNADVSYDRRGELLNRFGNWVELNKARINQSTDVYVLNAENVPKNLSSETIFNGFHRQRRPYHACYTGVSQVNATKYPDAQHYFQFINISTNSSMTNITEFDAEVASYGNLEQVLSNPNGYQNRRLQLVASINSRPGFMTGFRYPSTNNNLLRAADQAEYAKWFNGNKMAPYAISYSGMDDRMLDPGLAPSIELLNKKKTIYSLFNKIKMEAIKYAGSQGSGDNTWFSPAYLISNERTLAATINAVSDLKTFLYIINDAINSAIRSQMIKAAKVGAPDSTFIGITEKNGFNKNKFNTAYNFLWSSMKNLPLNKDVIDMWNKYKGWSKFNDHDLLHNENILQIPIFNILRAGGGRYKKDGDNYVLEAIDNSKDIETINTWRDKIFQTLIYTGQTLDGASYSLPQGDYYAFFLQTIIAGIAPANFVRVGRSNQMLANNSDTFETSNLIINGNQLANDFITRINPEQSLTNINMPTAGALTQRNNGNDLAPLTYGGSRINTTSVDNNISTHPSSGNFWWDMNVSAHTFTGFMAAFMEAIVNAYNRGDLNLWVNLFSQIDPFFSRLGTLNDNSNSSISFGDNIPNVDIINIKFSKELPQYSKRKNSYIYYPNYFVTLPGDVEWEPTRFNPIGSSIWNQYPGDQYKLIGLRYSAIDTNGKADRDIYTDNHLTTIITNNGLGKNIWGTSTRSGNSYMISHSIIRPNAFMRFEPNRDIADDSLFPVYIGEHVNSCILRDNRNYSLSTYINGGHMVEVGQIDGRSLLVNSSDDLSISIYPGTYSQAIRSQIIADYEKFINYVGLPVTSGNFVHPNWVPIATAQTLNTRRVISMYNNNSSAMILDHIVNNVYKRWDISDLECIPAQKFDIL